MVFVTVGTTDEDFKRLFIELDRIIEAGILDDVIAQIGNTDYEPKHFQYQHICSHDDFNDYLTKAAFIIAHGGTGTLEECLGGEKKVIVVPRQAQFKEAPDNHQFEIAEHLLALNRILLVRDIKELREKIMLVKQWKPASNKNPKKHTIIETINIFVNDNISIVSQY